MWEGRFGGNCPPLPETTTGIVPPAPLQRPSLNLPRGPMLPPPPRPAAGWRGAGPAAGAAHAGGGGGHNLRLRPGGPQPRAGVGSSGEGRAAGGRGQPASHPFFLPPAASRWAAAALFERRLTCSFQRVFLPSAWVLLAGGQKIGCS